MRLTLRRFSWLFDPWLPLLLRPGIRPAFWPNQIPDPVEYHMTGQLVILPRLSDRADPSAGRLSDSAVAEAAPAACRVCGSRDVISMGPPQYRQPTTAAGVDIDLTDLDLVHYRCNACQYQFIHPPVPEQRLLDCYRRAPVTYWETGARLEKIRLYPEKRQLVEQFAGAGGRRVLDFGCFDGGFLRSFGSGYQKYGIEPAHDAAQRARENGITILASLLDDLNPAAHEPFDAVIAFDVFEHLLDPVDVLKKIRRLLRPGGVIVIETGYSDARLWKKFGTLYPYCACVEHVGFFNEPSMRAAAGRAQLEVVHFTPSLHHRMTPKQHVIHGGYYLAYRGLRLLDKLRVPLPGACKRVARRPVPRLPQVKDHFLAVLREKNGEQA